MSARQLVSWAALSLLAGVAACGDDTRIVTGPGALTPSEFTSMTDALAAIIGTTIGVSAQASSMDAARIGSLAGTDFTFSKQCPVGGEILFVGILSAASSSTHYDLAATVTNCAARGRNGEVWTFDTHPSITITADRSTDGDNTLVTGVESGTIAWSNGSRSASCSLDLTSKTIYVASTRTFNVSLNGTVCGRTVVKQTVIDAP